MENVFKKPPSLIWYSYCVTATCVIYYPTILQFLVVCRNLLFNTLNGIFMCGTAVAFFFFSFFMSLTRFCHARIKTLSVQSPYKIKKIRKIF